MSLNFGMTASIIAARHIISITTATAVASVSSPLEAFILQIAHIAIMGAYINILRVRMFAICTC